MKKTASIVLSILLFFMTNCTTRTDSDLIIINAKVYTLDPAFSVTEAFAVKDGKILETGTSDYILGHYSCSVTTDLKGKTVYPGFIDAHCHFYGFGTGLREADLTGSNSFEEVLERVSAHAAMFSSAWIIGRGWDQNNWKIREFPDNSGLNKLFPETPVLLVRIDGHAALANSKALELAGIFASSKIEGGTVVLKNGKLSGMLIDNAVGILENAIPALPTEEMKSALLDAQSRCFAVGLTSVQDAGLPKNVIDAISQLNDSGALKMRIYAMLSPSTENFEAIMYKGVHKTDRLNIRSLKLYADGALGSRGARMIEPYSDDPENHGLWLMSPEKLKKLAELADSCGYQVNIHCIGDAANREVLNLYAGILKGPNDKRWRIEHAQVIFPDDMHLFRDFSIIPSVQPTHATSDMDWAESRIGAGRMKGAYAYKTLLGQNGWIPCGSDFPVEDINPVFGFFAACIRKDRNYEPKDGFMMNEALSREEALRGMTIWAAKAAFEENEKGSLEPGKLADFVVCDRDLMTVPEDSILGLKVEKTYSSGELVYQLGK
jgi:predicted amidohydrolase YtcJ